MEAFNTNDPCSFAQPDRCVVKHIDFDLVVDFNNSIISGTASLVVEKKQDDVDTLILDTRDLKIESVVDQATDQELNFKTGEKIQAFGSKLEITLPSSDKKELTISIGYATSSTCSALQWLRPEQTAGKKHPYLFSQCQAIHARSLFPCQDTPAVKFTYAAKVKAPKEITILMSAVQLDALTCDGEDSQKCYSFEQKVPIPSYLLAIVGGHLESREISARCRVWSEKELVDKAAYEFAETEQMLQTAEKMLGRYEWGRYDLLVLPPSFPYGGMENPCLTFVTPTLLAGDRSLADVVAHEISHSWTGNLVTNSSPEHFWLNEGHTVFVERKITSRMHNGEPLRQFLANEGFKELQETIKTLNAANEAAYTKLIPSLKGVDPDDAFSIVPYEKGFALLYYLETLLGGPETFEGFLKEYIARFRRQSINSLQWKEFLFDFFNSEADRVKLEAVDWDSWFYKEGIPPFFPQYDTSLAIPCETLSQRWLEARDSDLSAFTSGDLGEFSSLQTREFLSLLLQAESSLSVAKLEKMESLYHLNDVKNSEIRFRWLRLCLKGRWQKAISYALEFVTEQGRMKFVRPIYRDLYQWENARQKAIENFLAHKAEMHSTTAKEVAKDLHLTQ